MTGPFCFRNFRARALLVAIRSHSENVMESLGRWLTQLGVWTAHPLAGLVVLFYALFWWMDSPHTFEWHGIATLITWFMTLLIQRAEHRDTQAIHAKLDELIRNTPARNELAHLDELEPEQIERHRSTQETP